MLYGLVTGLSIRSRSVRIASVFGFLVSQRIGIELRRGETASASAASTAATARIGRRRRATHRIERRRPR